MRCMNPGVLHRVTKSMYGDMKREDNLQPEISNY